MNPQISGGVDSLTLIDEHGNTVCTFAKCDEEARQVANRIVQCQREWDELVTALKHFLSYFQSGNSVPIERVVIKANSYVVINARNILTAFGESSK